MTTAPKFSLGDCVQVKPFTPDSTESDSPLEFVGHRGIIHEIQTSEFEYTESPIYIVQFPASVDIDFGNDERLGWFGEDELELVL
jgi:hypothetical protein